MVPSRQRLRLSHSLNLRHLFSTVSGRNSQKRVGELAFQLLGHFVVGRFEPIRAGISLLLLLTPKRTSLHASIVPFNPVGLVDKL